jgi:hypothetical protein
MNSKTFIVPFWVMLAVSIFSAATNFISAIYVLRMQHPSSLTLVLLFFWPILLFIECVVYWIIRNRIMNKKMALGHLFFTFLGFFIFPLLFALANGLFLKNVPVRAINHFDRSNSWIRPFVFWISFILGSICFTAVLAKTFSKKQALDIEEPEIVNLLDDVVY